MQLKQLFSPWTRTAGLLLIGGALAWTIKLGVIISTNGRIIDTGASAISMNIGLLLLAVGSTGIGDRVSLTRATFLRITAILLSPALIFGSFFLFGMLTNPFFRNSSVWYAQQEAPIALAVVVYLVVGLFLYRSDKPVTR
jgi:hypothetical protein